MNFSAEGSRDLTGTTSVTDPATTSAAGPAEVACEVQELRLVFPGAEQGPVAALRGVDFTLRRGQTIGVVGESGSGKSMLGLALLGLSPANGQVSGRAEICGVDMVNGPERQRRQVRREHIGLILQDPGTAMNPVRRIRGQMREALRDAEVPMRERDARISRALQAVGLDPDRVLSRYPFQLSGGMQQRVVIAMAIVRQPTVLVADEPTTALDVTTQVAVLDLIAKLGEQSLPGVVFISHDLSVIRQIADDVIVLYGGRVFEQGPADEVINRPRQPYTQGLVSAIPRLGQRGQDLVSLPGYPEPARLDDLGCPIRARCPRAQDRCAEAFPEPTVVGPGHTIACWNPVEESGAA